jgi:hypothetical protein
VHPVGRINREIFQCITKDISTDEVIITDERIEHIEDHHPGDYELLRPFYRQALNNPDYILEDKKTPSNTGLILKRIKQDDLRFQMVLRLKTSNDPENYKNSIISAWHIGEARWENYVNNKKILYKRE